jgi:gentisate 1,2-dioxygenase
MDSPFNIGFMLDGKQYQATVAVLKGKDHIQYTISPTDEALELKYGNQVVHQFPGRPMEFAFPINGHHQEPYNKAVGDALRRAVGHTH